MESPREGVISEVNEEDHEYGMPLTEVASIPTMGQLSGEGVNRKLANIFGAGAADCGGSSRPVSTHSGVFGGIGGSAASPNASFARNTGQFLGSSGTSRGKVSQFASV